MRKTSFSVIETVKQLEKIIHIKKSINLSIIGCVVNGPGEAAQTEISLTGGGQDNNLLYLSGILIQSCKCRNNRKSCSFSEEKVKETIKLQMIPLIK